MRAQLYIDTVDVHEHSDGTASVCIEGRDPITGDRNRMGVLCDRGERRPAAGDTVEHTATVQLMPRKSKRTAR